MSTPSTRHTSFSFCRAKKNPKRQQGGSREQEKKKKKKKKEEEDRHHEPTTTSRDLFSASKHQSPAVLNMAPQLPKKGERVSLLLLAK